MSCNTQYSARIVLPTGFLKLSQLRNSANLADGMVIIAKQEADRRFAMRLRESGEAIDLLKRVFWDFSASFLWFGPGKFVAFFDRPRRDVLNPGRFEDLLPQLVVIVQEIERLQG